MYVHLRSCGPEPPLVERIERTVTIVREVEEIEGEIDSEV